jgi:hypothetical protein
MGRRERFIMPFGRGVSSNGRRIANRERFNSYVHGMSEGNRIIVTLSHALPPRWLDRIPEILF